MKTKIMIETEVDIKILNVSAKVRYWEDGTLNVDEDTDGNMPCRSDDYWCPKIDVDSGQILNWEKGNSASIHYKVCDCCAWSIHDQDGKILGEGDGYVPSTLSPGGSGYGDYIIMTVNADGFIDKWRFKSNEFTKHNEE